MRGLLDDLSALAEGRIPRGKTETNEEETEEEREEKGLLDDLSALAEGRIPRTKKKK